MLQIYLNNLSFFILKIFKITKLSFFYIKYLFICLKYLSNILNIFDKIIVDKRMWYSYTLFKHFLFKKIFINKNTYYKTLISKSLNELSCLGLTISSPNINTYLLQKNFSFYYLSFLIKKKTFTIVLNYRKFIFLMFSFKLILFNMYFYNIKVMVWGTQEFENEINALNEIFTIKNFEKSSIQLLLTKKVFCSDITYNLEVHFFFRNFSKLVKRNLVFITLQNTGNGAFILQRFKYFSFGCLTNLKLKHTYGFLIPVHIKYNFSKFFIYSLIISYKNISSKYQLIFFLLYFFKYKLLITCK